MNLKGINVLLLVILFFAEKTAAQGLNNEGVRLNDCPVNENPINPTQLPYPGDCTKFYKCAFGYGYPINCPAGLYWNDKAKQCDWPELANCELNFNPTLLYLSDQNVDIAENNKSQESSLINYNNSEVQSSLIPTCPEEEIVSNPSLLPYPGNCSKFYKCSNMVPVPFSCPDGLHFNAVHKVCDWPSNANCEQNTVPNEDWRIASNNDSNLQCPVYEDPANPSLFPYPGNCSKFYQCANMELVPLTCPQGLHFNKELKVCDWPSNANCAQNTIPNEIWRIASNNDSNQQCPINEDPRNATLLPFPGNCSKFYKCFNGSPVPQNCPAGLHWNTELRICDWPENANCEQVLLT